MRRNIVYHVTGQYMRMNKKRTFTTFLGIIFMVLLMTCVFVGKNTAIEYLEQVASEKDGKWHVILYDVTKKEQEEVEQLEGVEKTSVSADYGFTEFAKSGNELTPYLKVKAYQADCFDWMNIELKKGRLPETVGEVVISEAAVSDGADIAIGDTIKTEYFTRFITGIDEKIEGTFFPFQNIYITYGETVEVPQDFPYYGENTSFEETREYTGDKQELTVVGFIEAPSYETEGAAAYTAITLLDQKAAEALAGFNLSIKLDLANLPASYESVFRELAGEREIDFNDYVLAFSGKSADSTINFVVNFLTVFFVILIIFASVILIYNVFNMSFEERSRYLGMLSSVGATGRQKRSSIYYEAFRLLIFALPVGILSGLGVVKLGMTALQPFLGKLMSFERYMGNVPVTLFVSWKEIAAIVVMSIATVLVSAYLPARRIGKIGPIECIRGNVDKKCRQYKMNMSAAEHGSAEWMLAGNMMKRQSKKTRAITAAAAAFIVILLVTTFGASALEKTMKEKIGDAFDMKINGQRWDYFFAGYDSQKDAFERIKKEIEQAEGIAQAVEWSSGMFVGELPKDCYSEEYWRDVHDIYNLYYEGGLDDEEFQKMTSDFYMMVNILGVDSQTLKEIAKATGADLEMMENKDISGAIVVQEGVLSTKNTGIYGMEPEKQRFFEVKQMTDKKVGEELPIDLYSEKSDERTVLPVQVAGYATNEQLEKFVSFHSQYLWLIVSEDTAEQISRLTERTDGFSNLSSELYIRTSEENPEILNRLMKLNELGDGECIFMRTDYEATLEEAIIGIVRILLVCFVLLTSVICMLNLFNSICGRINGRAREFAVMESVGMTKKQIEKMLLYESIGIVLKSIFYAALIAFPLICLIKYGMIAAFGPMTVRLPWMLVLVAALLTMSVVILLTKYCYQREKHENILEQVRNESV